MHKNINIKIIQLKSVKLLKFKVTGKTKWNNCVLISYNILYCYFSETTFFFLF